MDTSSADVLVVGAGPAGSAAASWAARYGLDVLLLDAQEFPRDKACGDGLTPRAIAEMRRLGMGDWLTGRPVNWGLRATGFGRTWHLPWPSRSLPSTGSAVARTELDAAILGVATASGARFAGGWKAVGAERGERDRVTAVRVTDGREQRTVTCRRLIVADGARSRLGRELGRTWHRDTVYGVAARAYVPSARSDDPWISSHLELRAPSGDLLGGYGWVFPLGNGMVNLGVGTLATDHRPADVGLRGLVDAYYRDREREWGFTSPPQRVKSALLPMGGAVSGVAGPNWVLVGDAAGCVNPLNGEGIDYGLETGRLAAELFASGGALNGDSAVAWGDLLTERYGPAFSGARRLAAVLTHPDIFARIGPIGLRSRALMLVALRVMGNLVTEEDNDVVARLWRMTGRSSIRIDERPPFAA